MYSWQGGAGCDGAFAVIIHHVHNVFFVELDVPPEWVAEVDVFLDVV